jgi:hypothetical protein
VTFDLPCRLVAEAIGTALSARRRGRLGHHGREAGWRERCPGAALQSIPTGAILVVIILMFGPVWAAFAYTTVHAKAHVAAFRHR